MGTRPPEPPARSQQGGGDLLDPPARPRRDAAGEAAPRAAGSSHSTNTKHAASCFNSSFWRKKAYHVAARTGNPSLYFLFDKLSARRLNRTLGENLRGLEVLVHGSSSFLSVAALCISVLVSNGKQGPNCLLTASAATSAVTDVTPASLQVSR